jgi:glycosyltransferase involved in cell wall biosynthesis
LKLVTVLIANPSPDVYGSDLQMLESASAMTELGWRVVVAIPGDGPLVPRLRERGVEVIFCPFPVLRRANASVRSFLEMVGSAVAAVPRMLRTISTVRPDVVYVNTVTLPWWLLASRLARTPTIVHVHEAENTDSWLIRTALTAPLRLATAVIVISESAREATLSASTGLRRKIRLIYNGVPSPPEEPQPPARRPPYRLITVGRLSPRKAPHLALETAGRLRVEGYDVRLELAGSAFEGYEWYVDELRARADRPDLAGHVDFSGYCSPIWPAFARSDLVVAPSLREPFGNAVIEAQLSLRPVVATAALGHLESITHEATGLLVPPEDVEAMVAAVRRLLDDAEFAAGLAIDAQRNACSRFGVQRYAAEITSLVAEVAGRRR